MVLPLTELPDLDSLRCFVEAARTLNFRAAAKVVGLTPAALGQRIRQLEDLVQGPLFFRTTRKVMLSEDGLALLPHAKRTLEAAEDCLRSAAGQLEPPPLELVIGTRHELGLSWLLPMFPKLARAHPQLVPNLYFGSGEDLLLRVRALEIDCAISSTRLTEPKIDSIKLHREEYVFVGSPKLLKQIPFSKEGDAALHTLVDVNAQLPLFRYWRDAPGGIDSLAFRRVLRMGTIAAIRQVVRRAEGVAVLPSYFVEQDLATGRLETILPGITPLADYFRLLFRADDPRRALFEGLAETLLGEDLK